MESKTELPNISATKFEKFDWVKLGVPIKEKNQTNNSHAAVPLYVNFILYIFLLSCLDIGGTGIHYRSMYQLSIHSFLIFEKDE